MINKLKFAPALLAASVLSLTSCEKDGILEQASQQIPQTSTNGAETGRYIVVLKFDSASANARLSKQTAEQNLNNVLQRVNSLKVNSEHKFTSALNGFSAKLSEQQLNELKADPSVDFIEPEVTIRLEQTTSTTTTTTTQQVPWGVTRVGRGSASTSTKTAWIIDSGIQLNHPDLRVDAGRSRSFLSTTTSPNDQNGHGTMVAGIIGAKSNTFGVVGVAYNAKLVALRTMDATGTGTSTAVVAALNYVAQNGIAGDVVNMSLGGPASLAIDNALKAVANKGILVAVAAGNSATSVLNVSPARVNHTNVFTVSAMGQNDYWASFSNYGSPTVDYCAPGVGTLSTTINSGYASGNGTSFAAPHLAGLLILKGKAIVTNGYVMNDPDGVADKIPHK